MILQGQFITHVNRSTRAFVRVRVITSVKQKGLELTNAFKLYILSNLLGPRFKEMYMLNEALLRMEQ